MDQADGKRGTLYEQVLEYARRETDEASSKIEELQRTLRLLEARVEAAKSVYESVAARLNLEDELEEGTELQEVSYPDAPPPPPAPEPPEDIEPVESSGNGGQSAFAMDLIRRHLAQKSEEKNEEEADAGRTEARRTTRPHSSPGSRRWTRT